MTKIQFKWKWSEGGTKKGSPKWLLKISANINLFDFADIFCFLDYLFHVVAQPSIVVGEHDALIDGDFSVRTLS